ncbi:MinD/ParA family protein [Sporosalibacterium faouarense]|uniref:MinD/ParA family protein n=1 Tax=Sporosalibacterium faouarense TaxID=516123 RepID=UPI00141C8B5F|nr:MinD/ParA family protein [Sporosalibacterium faouarense]MTI48010.1 MinD/ParA family protein [Bacillota bacterium]
MRDQAERLRQIILHNKTRDTKTNLDNTSQLINKSKVLSVTSGKGGVGKTNFAINLSISLSKLGYKVVVFDADIGLANIDVILGIIPKYTIADVLDGSKNILDIMTEGPNGIKIIAGGSGIKSLVNLDSQKLDILTRQLQQLDNYADYIIIDTGAGLSNTVLNFVNSSDEVILITTPEPTSLTDVYAMIKTLRTNGGHNKLSVVINKVENSDEADEVFNRLSRVSHKFLNTTIEKLGFVNDSKLVMQSVKNQDPFILLYPNSSISKKINSIALKISGNQDTEDDGGIGNFVKRFRSLFSKGDT